jgi:dTDP-4-amino-4,6-dideoxygalactose transaminase
MSLNRCLLGTYGEEQVIGQWDDFAWYTGVKQALVVISGTAALHATIVGEGVEPGDEAITLGYSFIATISSHSFLICPGSCTCH